jgi:peptide/nickel transport system substrate-binding protein
MLCSKLSRRVFLRLSALVAGSALAACAPTPVPPTPIPPTAVPKATVASTAVPPTAAPKATVAPTAVPPTAAPKATVAPTAVPPTAAPKAAAYKESPLLAEQVKAGKLPPIDQRLPKDPLVMKVEQKIGKYGGTLRMAYAETNLWFFAHMRAQGLFMFDQLGTKTLPDIAKGFKWSSDLKTLTLELREGHKWSDGSPFTVEDIMFWWEDFELTKDLKATPNVFWTPGAKPMAMKKVSPSVLEITFAVPYPVAMDMLGRTWYSTDPEFILPKSYMSKYHIKYNPKADDLAKEEKFEDWKKAFVAKQGRAGLPTFIPERPYLWAWNPEKRSTERANAVRNPYFHQVDAEGNQLPYTDYCECLITGNKEVQLLKGASGELDWDACYLSLTDMPVLRENETKGKYHVLLPSSLRPSCCMLQPNRTCKDADYQKLFNTKDFRVAMSIGFNRKAINDTLFFGLAKPYPALPLPSNSYFKPEWGNMYIEFDQAKANQLLDGVGLTKKDAQGFRMRPDGKDRISLLIEIGNLEYPKQAICEMIKADWEKIGLEAQIRVVDGTLFGTRLSANELVIGTHHTDATTLWGRARSFYFGMDDGHAWNSQWASWFKTGGQGGIEPPEEIKKLKALQDQWKQTLPDTPEFIKLGGEYFGWYANELPMIGTVGFVPQPMIISNRMKNVPEKDIYWGADTSFLPPYKPTTWFIEE